MIHNNQTTVSEGQGSGDQIHKRSDINYFLMTRLHFWRFFVKEAGKDSKAIINIF